MARRVWLLVEWVDESDVFPSYGVVNIDTYTYNPNDLSPGKQILINMKFNQPKSAKIIRIAENKQHVEEHKEFLERQDRQVKNVLQLCMRTIKEMKSEPFMGSSSNSPNKETISKGTDNSRPIVTALSDVSENESEPSTLKGYHQKPRSYSKRISHPVQKASSNGPQRSSLPAVNQRHRSMVCSTPIPSNRRDENVKLFLDQGTQTDHTLMQPYIAMIEEMENELRHLYGTILNVVSAVKDANNDSTEFEIEGAEVSFIEPSTRRETINESDGQLVIDESDYNQKPQENTETNGTVNQKNDNEETTQQVADITRVRRMSAHTTNSMELVPIGNGHAMVSARLLNDINWNFYTTATRQLLQALFSRKVLATHSLTGKQSPAHSNKPAKKVLDPNVVNDIVLTVSTRCGVPKNLVRNSITIKCTDEAKLYRNRQKKQQARMKKKRPDEENIPPSQTPSSDEISNVVS